ncbi:glycosyltransferase [Candidatus Nitrosotenuis uzonensis]|uniref:Glycosyltransferase n=1 Tax=Candidatus Nitrosotenuis uzonensis TaxID=1407055 RepID=V6AUC0_9ARCH|nr:glycosyltransferase [Candidatus Nitrosotenuis uzonensis]CDI06466.1 putative Glycosyltransferase [Candidatus Nitrosotenuis uzonensis]
MKICIFPNDPLLAYYKKGEIKSRYFNPKNVFDEIHVISLFDSDIEEEKVKSMAGNADLKIHVVGKTTLLNYKKKKDVVKKIVKKISPDVIRSYNPLLQGWIAVKVGKELNIPVIISLMGDYDRDLRYFAKKNKDWQSYLKLSYSRRALESFSIKNADEIIIIYEFIRNYAKKMGAKNINLIYNRVDLTRFSPDVPPAFKESKPVIICVGRLMKEKNQECLVRAIKDLDVILLLVGDGPEYERLKSLVGELGLQDKVRFERSIPNNDINKFYAASNVFALPIKYGGFAIPVLEAAASGLPVILPKQEFDSNPDLINKFAMFIDNNPSAFARAITKVLSDSGLREKMIKAGLDAVKKIHGDIMEEREKDLYLKIIKKN